MQLSFESHGVNSSNMPVLGLTKKALEVLHDMPAAGWGVEWNLLRGLRRESGSKEGGFFVYEEGGWW